jgi:hypothetical protein
VLVLVFAGFVNADAFRAAVVPAAGPAWLSRLAVLVAIGFGAGMICAAVPRLRSLGPRAVDVRRPDYRSRHD